MIAVWKGSEYPEQEDCQELDEIWLSGEALSIWHAEAGTNNQ